MRMKRDPVSGEETMVQLTFSDTKEQTKNTWPRRSPSRYCQTRNAFKPTRYWSLYCSFGCSHKKTLVGGIPSSKTSPPEYSGICRTLRGRRCPPHNNALLRRGRLSRAYQREVQGRGVLLREGNALSSRVLFIDKITFQQQILDWHVQISLALEYMHNRRVLHRDLKTSNVFLTKNNVVKLGDFGIAKVLDCTLEQANTVVGTPYYMSKYSHRQSSRLLIVISFDLISWSFNRHPFIAGPEVCENKPYSYQSDLWALGCVLYEMCTLKHAFDANNLLGLVFKIVQDTYPPIPDRYADGMHDLVRCLLSKDPKLRHSIQQMLRIPYVRDHMGGKSTVHVCMCMLRYAAPHYLCNNLLFTWLLFLFAIYSSLLSVLCQAWRTQAGHWVK